MTKSTLLKPMGTGRAWSLGCYGTVVGVPLLIVVVAIVSGVDLSRPPFSGVLLAVGAIAIIFVAAVASTILSRRARSNSPVFEQFYKQHGGFVHKPTLLDPLLVPCWIGEVDGAPVRISVSRIVRGSRHTHVTQTVVNAANAGPWKLPEFSYDALTVDVWAPISWRLGVVCRSPLASVGALFGHLQEVHSGDESFDGRFVAYTNDAGLAGRLLDSGRQPIVQLLSFNAPWISRLVLSPNGAQWHGILTDATGPQAVATIVRDLLRLARKAAKLA